MTTTYSNPKEMLGYLVVKFIERQLEILPIIPYDRRAVFAFYYQLKGLDSQLASFRSDMYLYDFKNGSKIPYNEAMPQIEKVIQDNFASVYAKDYDSFLKALYKWSELMANAYPKLGLVPETGEISRAHQEDNVMEDNAYGNDAIPGEGFDENGPALEPQQSNPEPEREPEPVVHSQPIAQANPKPGPSGPVTRQRFSF